MMFKSFVDLRWAFAALALVMSFQAAAADQLDRVKQRGKLIVGVKNDYPPFGSLNANGEIEGFEIDLAKAVAKELTGRDDAIEMVPVIASNRIEFLNAGRVDILFATLAPSPERAKALDFTKPYYMLAGIVLLAPKDSPYKSWDDVKGQRLCSQQGNLYNKELIEKYGADMALFNGTPDMFKAFLDGRCVGIAFDEQILRQKLRDPAWNAKYDIVVPTFSFVPLVGGVRKGEPAFMAAVNEAIKKAEASGLLVEAEKRYSMGESEFVAKQKAEASQ